MTFKDRHPEIQHLVREHKRLRDHNLRFNEGGSEEHMLLFAEGALIVLLFERFIRAVLGDATDRETFRPLLGRAVSRKLVSLPWLNQMEGIEKVSAIRNTLLHGNYEQAAQQSGCSSVSEYFGTQYASEIEAMCKIVDHIFKQIDPATGFAINREIN